MNKRKNRRRLIFSLLVVGILIWIGSKVKDHLEFQQEMVRIVHSKEVEKIVIENLKQKDPFAFTEKGKIQSFKIDDEISSSLTELESSLDQVIGTIDSDLAGKFSNSVKEGVGRKKLELNALQEFCKTK